MNSRSLQPSAAPRILLTASLRWPTAARLALAFSAMGCNVAAICPRQHPVAKTRSIGTIYRHSALQPLVSLRAAIESVRPDLIVPCDDNAALHLLKLYELVEKDGDQSSLRNLIAHSLGAPAACALATRRGTFIALADSERVRVPATAVVRTLDELTAWLDLHGYPAVLKIDCTWGGQGVAVVRYRAEAQREFARMSARPSIANAIVRMLLERDSSFVLNALRAERPTLSVQKFIDGMPANRAVACWQGEVLAGISVQAIETQHVTGPATVVQVIEHAEMAEATKRLVRRLGVSGLWGIDFVLHESGAAYVVEMNPRATPICHLPLGPLHNLPAALYSQLARVAPDVVPKTIEQNTIALFPGEWHRHYASPYLRSAYHDIPWDEPALIQDCIDRPWSERGIVARLWARLRTLRLPRSRARTGNATRFGIGAATEKNAATNLEQDLGQSSLADPSHK